MSQKKTRTNLVNRCGLEPSFEANEAHSNLKLGRFPDKRPTVTAEVLADLLEGRHLTSRETVDRSSTTRLSAYIHFLFRKYRWPVVSKRIHVPTADGRVANVSEFWLEPEFRKRAIQIQQVKDWILEIRRLREKQRAVVAEKRRRKKSRSTMMRSCYDILSPQSDFFAGGFSV